MPHNYLYLLEGEGKIKKINSMYSYLTSKNKKSNVVFFNTASNKRQINDYFQIFQM